MVWMKSIMNFSVDPFYLFIQWVFIEYLLCSDSQDKAIKKAAWDPSPPDHASYQKAKGTAWSGLKEGEWESQDYIHFWNKNISHFQPLCCSHLPFSYRKSWPGTEGSPPTIFDRDHYNDWSPHPFGLSLLSRSMFLLWLYRLGLPWLWVLGWHHLHLQLQCSFVCTWKIPFPRLCPVPKFVYSTTMLNRLQIPRLYHFQGPFISTAIL